MRVSIIEMIISPGYGYETVEIQRRSKIAWKASFKTCILNNDWIVRVENHRPLILWQLGGEMWEK